jgi:shikimate kinase
MLADSPLSERIITLMAQRSATYEKTAHVILDTDGKSIETIASEIISTLNI